MRAQLVLNYHGPYQKPQGLGETLCVLHNPLAGPGAGLQGGAAPRPAGLMVLIVDGNSEHVAHV